MLKNCMLHRRFSFYLSSCTADMMKKKTFICSIMRGCQWDSYHSSGSDSVAHVLFSSSLYPSVKASPLHVFARVFTSAAVNVSPLSHALVNFISPSPNFAPFFYLFLFSFFVYMLPIYFTARMLCSPGLQKLRKSLFCIELLFFYSCSPPNYDGIWGNAGRTFCSWVPVKSLMASSIQTMIIFSLFPTFLFRASINLWLLLYSKLKRITKIFFSILFLSFLKCIKNEETRRERSVL